MMKNNLLIAFARHPEYGKVKTRLAADIGNDLALAVYQKLLSYTKEQVISVDAELAVYYADTVPTEDIWKELVSQRHQQQGADLGERLSNAFQEGFNGGFKKVIIIGTDCPEFSSDLAMRAFHELEKSELVLGPAKDGGYYLIGLTRFTQEIFSGKSWSSSKLLEETLNTASLLGLSTALLPELTDIDRASDLEAFPHLCEG